MRKLFSVLLLSLSLTPFSSYTICSTLPSCFSPAIQEATLEVGSGFRVDHFNWNVAGEKIGHHKFFPNILSELKWDELRMWTVDGKLVVVTCNDVYLRADGTFGSIYHGTVRDSDFYCDDRSGIFSQSRSNAGKGRVFDVSGAIGYQYVWVHGALVIIPLAGYSHDAQHLHMFDGDQEICCDRDSGELLPIGRIHRLNSTYKASWFGPWIGMNLGWNVNRCFSIFAEYQYHWPRYRGTGEWNLREDLPDGFHHRARGKGHVIEGNATYEFCDGWTFGVDCKYQIFRTYKGTDRFKILINVLDINGEVIGTLLCPVETQLNHVNWRSLAFRASLGYDF